LTSRKKLIGEASELRFVLVYLSCYFYILLTGAVSISNWFAGERMKNTYFGDLEEEGYEIYSYLFFLSKRWFDIEKEDDRRSFVAQACFVLGNLSLMYIIQKFLIIVMYRMVAIWLIIVVLCCYLSF
jgi:hypothetical protein